MISFQCPACSSPLRMKDLGPRSRTISCPNCSVKIHLQIEQGELIHVSEESAQLPLPPTSLPSQGKFRLIFGVLGAVVTGIIIFFTLPSGDAKAPIGDNLPDETEVAGNSSNQTLPEVAPASDEQSPVVPTAKRNPVEERLKKIHKLINEYQTQTGLYPNGKMLESDGEPAHFSWIAEVMKTADREGSLMASRRPWNDPVNDAFVRRRLEQFRNPEITKVAGADRYPTTHFAGVSGVGVDAEKLPLRHPRAGMFSPFRETSIADVLDGTSNTIMIVGIEKDYGAWARPGRATLRSFTKEPYINGPDGMGTGQDDSMMVLMADGSVRTLSKKTSPVIARRMATIADGLTLSMKTEGDPLTMQVASSGKNPDVKTDSEQEDDSPISPLLAKDPPPFDIHVSLSQKLHSYKLEQPQSLKIILRELQELSGVPMDLSSLSDETLASETTLIAEDVTLQELFEQLIDSQGLSMELKPFAIVIREAEEELKAN